MGCMIRGTNPSRKEKFISSPKQSTLALRPIQPPIQWVHRGVFSHKQRGWAMRLTTHLHLVPRLRMSGNVRPLTRYASTQTNLPFYFDIFFQKSSSGTILVRLPLISHMITMRFAFITKLTPPVCVHGDWKGFAPVFSLTLSKNKILSLTLSRKYGLMHKPIVLATGGSYIKQGFV
jgi:hypothetical protein